MEDVLERALEAIASLRRAGGRPALRLGVECHQHSAALGVPGRGDERGAMVALVPCRRADDATSC